MQQTDELKNAERRVTACLAVLDGASYHLVAESLNVSVDRVRQICRRALMDAQLHARRLGLDQPEWHQYDPISSLRGRPDVRDAVLSLLEKPKTEGPFAELSPRARNHLYARASYLRIPAGQLTLEVVAQWQAANQLDDISGLGRTGRREIMNWLDRHLNA